MSAPETIKGDAADVPPSPTYLAPDFDRMPAELKDRPNWVLWVPIWNGSKWTKRPIQLSGYGASTTNAKHWSSFQDAQQAYEAAMQRGFIELYEKGRSPRQAPIGGIGFVFDGRPDHDGLVLAGVDFDHVMSGAGVASLAQQRVALLGSYTEQSVSGTGLHVIVKARPLPSGVSSGGVELYTGGRYFTMTGCAPDASQIAAATEVTAAPDVFAALADSLRQEAGRGAALETTASSANVLPFKAPEWAIKGRPAAAFAHLPLERFTDLAEPNIAQIRAAVAAIPPSAIATEPEWMKLARALAHEASIHRSYTEQLWGILDEASRAAPGYDQQDNRSRFLRYIDEAPNSLAPTTIGTVFYMARQHGWDGTASAGMTGASSSEATGEGSFPSANAGLASRSRAVHVSALPLVPAKRGWLHGTDLIRGAVTVLAAPGGRAKSTWLLGCALACSSGRDLLGSHVFGGNLRVLLVSTEDGLPELALRLRAAMKHYALSDADLPALHVIGADRWGLPLLHMEGNRAVLDGAGMSALILELDHLKPDVLIIDPLINLLGGVSTNDNAGAALLMRQLVSLAITRRMAVALAHHTSKGRDLGSAESAMGAASFTNLARIALSIEPLEEKNAGAVGLPPWEAKSVFRVLGTKQNFSPPKTDDRWFRLVSVAMPNAEPPIYLTGDQVAVVEPFQPGVTGSAFPDALVRDALIVIDMASPPLTPSKRSSERYAAPVIADAIKTHRGGHVSEADGKAVLDHLTSAGLVVVADVKVSRGGKGSDVRKGLILTPAGRVALRQAAPATSSNPPPQPAQTPATTLQDDAGGDASAAPATQGGCGGNAAGAGNAGDLDNSRQEVPLVQPGASNSSAGSPEDGWEPAPRPQTCETPSHDRRV